MFLPHITRTSAALLLAVIVTTILSVANPQQTGDHHEGSGGAFVAAIQKTMKAHKSYYHEKTKNGPGSAHVNAPNHSQGHLHGRPSHGPYPHGHPPNGHPPLAGSGVGRDPIAQHRARHLERLRQKIEQNRTEISYEEHEKLALEYQNKFISDVCKAPYESKRAASINYVEWKSGRIRAKGEEELVMVTMHGHGGGLALFSLNIDMFLKDYDRIISIDLPGFGLSGRENATVYRPVTTTLNYFESKERRMEREHNITMRSQNYFSDSIEKWRQSVGIEKMVICMHSFGGLIGGKYAVKYPGAVRAMIWISPIGLEGVPVKEERTYHLGDMIARGLWYMNISPQSIARSTFSPLDFPLGPIKAWCLQDMGRGIRGLSDGEFCCVDDV
jgi:pimeloyl-ACP methyl ester carboxylesterase